MFFNGSIGFAFVGASIVGSAFGASSSIGGNSFTGASASIVLVISGSTSDIYNILYILSIFFYIFCLYGQIEKYIIFNCLIEIKVRTVWVPRENQ